MAEDWQESGFGLYIHWPFCEAKCPYCDFNSHVARSIDHARWEAAYLAEIDRYAALLPGRVLGTVFFGGGTPSLMRPDSIATLLERIRAHWPVANDFEVTLEANPGSVEAGRFRAFAQAGINRVSIGVQSLDDTDLKRLGRIHTASEAVQAMDIAAKTFPRFSFDLIYGRQEQTPAQWSDELRLALSLAGEHVSLYQLTIEPGTAFGDRYRLGRLRGLPDEDRAAELYDRTQELCDAYGLIGYEISNHARPGGECRHNMIYWRYGDYIGIGPGAHGRITVNGQRLATETCLQPNEWLDAAGTGNGEKSAQALSQQQQGAEYAMMSIRLAEGLDMERHVRLSGSPLDSGRIEFLAGLGLVEIKDRRLMATARGRLLLNAVTGELLKG